MRVRSEIDGGLAISLAVVCGSMGEVVAFRVEFTGTLGRSRTLDERLFMRLPVVYRRLSALTMRLRPRSRLRQALLRRTVASSFPAFNRGDFQRVLVAFADDIEYVAPAGIQALGMPAKIRGREALRRAYADTFEDWGRWEMAPAWVLDLGNVLVVLTAISLRGRGSGVELESEWASVYEMRGGLVARQQDFLSWEEALRAAKVDQNELPPILQRKARQPPITTDDIASTAPRPPEL